jgi:membrane associated rhomboid family serine protease
MSDGPDLFVVCSQCGSEVSPYVTECPYCGHRLRKRAPNLPRETIPGRAPRGIGGRLRAGRAGRAARLRAGRGGRTALAPSRARTRVSRTGLLAGTHTAPRATIVLVAASAVAWVVWHAHPSWFFEAAIIGPLDGKWWRLFTSGFAYGNGIYAFITVLAIAIFGWLVERRHGPAVVIALFLGAGALGALAAEAAYALPVVTGANAAALALLAAWAAPDLLALRSDSYYEGDLTGAGIFAVLLLAEPFAIYGPSWLAGVVGGLLGLLVGGGLAQLVEPDL